MSDFAHIQASSLSERDQDRIREGVSTFLPSLQDVLLLCWVSKRAGPDKELPECKHQRNTALHDAFKASASNAGDPGLIPGSGRSPVEGTGNPLQYSCLDNPKARGGWWATVHRATKSWTRLCDFTFTFHDA